MFFCRTSCSWQPPSAPLPAPKATTQHAARRLWHLHTLSAKQQEQMHNTRACCLGVSSYASWHHCWCAQGTHSHPRSTSSAACVLARYPLGVSTPALSMQCTTQQPQGVAQPPPPPLLETMPCCCLPVRLTRHTPCSGPKMHSTAGAGQQTDLFLRPRVAQVGGGKQSIQTPSHYTNSTRPLPMHLCIWTLCCYVVTTALQGQVQKARLGAGRRTLALLRAAAPQLLQESTPGEDGSHPAARLSPQRHKSHVHYTCTRKICRAGQQPLETYLRFPSQLKNTHSVIRNSVPALLPGAVHPLQGQGLYLAD